MHILIWLVIVVATSFLFVFVGLHQYLQVKVGESWIDFDPAGSGVRGLPLGTHAEWFG